MEEKETDNTKRITEELIERGLKDQQMRIDHQNPNKKVPFDENIDFENTKWLKEIVTKIGWPTPDKVGEAASHAAWLIVQHADHDIDFQKLCLALLSEAFEQEQVKGSCLAYLTDRVAVNSDQEQTYGTQFHRNESGNLVPKPIKDREKIEERRKKMGLEPFSVYEQKMTGKFKYPDGYTNPMVGGIFYKIS